MVRVRGIAVGALRVGAARAATAGYAGTTTLRPFVQAACCRRVGAAQAATALLRSRGVSIKQDQDQDQTPKASATKAAGNFLLSKATKVRLDSLWSKVTKEVAFALNHKPARTMHPRGFFIRDIPVPMKNGLHPCRPPFGSSVAFASARRRTTTAKAKATTEAGT